MNKFPIPDEAFEQHGAVLGKTGSGKSSTLRLIVERLLDHGKRVCVVDPKGDWWGLRGNYPVIILGSEGRGDIQLSPKAGSRIGEVVGKSKEPFILDFGGWMVGDRTRFWIDFASSLFRHNSAPLWLVIDEVHNFAAQGKILDPDAGKCLHWTNRLASEGRGRGFRIWMASQRPQKVHKDTLTCAETLIAMRVIHPLDRKAIKEWIDGCGDPTHGNQVLNSLAQMKRGEGWVWSPEIGFLDRIRFPKFKSHDSFDPKVRFSKEVTRWMDVDIVSLRSELEDIEQPKPDDRAVLKAEISRLNSQIKELERNPQVDLGIAREIADQVLKCSGIITQALSDFTKVFEPIVRRPIVVNRVEQRREPEAVRNIKSGVWTQARDSSFTGGCLAVMKAVAQYGDAGVDDQQIAILTGYKKTSRTTFKQRLKSLGYIDQSGGRTIATAAGIKALGDDFEPLPTGPELRSYWMNRLSGGELEVFSILVGVWPNSLSNNHLNQVTGYKKTSLTTFRQRLSARKLIVVSGGEAKASDNLFQ